MLIKFLDWHYVNPTFDLWQKQKKPLIWRTTAKN